jgi:enolase-phosphatase E1
VVLLDIEGTTTPITFVYDQLFPYARSHLRAFLRASPERETRQVIESLRAEHSAERTPPDVGSWTSDAVEAAARYAEWLMDIDRKSPALKSLQGMIWQGGYASGALRGDVYEDVSRALDRWTGGGARCAIYSSGSVLAQRLLFSSTRYGDLTTRLSGFFDTEVGAKQSPSSYQEIARRFDVPPAAVLFVSDVMGELLAAKSAGCEVVLTVRPGNPPQPAVDGIPMVRSFDEIID